MQPLSFLAAVRHAAESISAAEVKLLSESVNEISVHSPWSMGLSKIRAGIEKEELSNCRLEAANQFLNSKGSSSNSSISLSTKWQIESYLMDSCTLSHTFITDGECVDTYRLMYRVGNVVTIDSIVEKTDYLASNLGIYYMLKQGYRIQELIGEDSYMVTKPSGGSSLIDSKNCDCREFNLINRGRKPCRHLQFKAAYAENKSLFIKYGVAELT